MLLTKVLLILKLKEQYSETKLQDIYNFLQSEIQSPNNKKQPSYIKEAIQHNKQIESNKNE